MDLWGSSNVIDLLVINTLIKPRQCTMDGLMMRRSRDGFLEAKSKYGGYWNDAISRRGENLIDTAMTMVGLGYDATKLVWHGPSLPHHATRHCLKLDMRSNRSCHAYKQGWQDLISQIEE